MTRPPSRTLTRRSGATEAPKAQAPPDAGACGCIPLRRQRPLQFDVNEAVNPAMMVRG